MFEFVKRCDALNGIRHGRQSVRISAPLAKKNQTALCFISLVVPKNNLRRRRDNNAASVAIITFLNTLSHNGFVITKCELEARTPGKEFGTHFRFSVVRKTENRCRDPADCVKGETNPFRVCESFENQQPLTMPEKRTFAASMKPAEAMTFK